MKDIKISAGDITVLAELGESLTARKIWEVLPVDRAVNRWGDEIYFGIPVKIEEEPDAQDDVQVGDLGYWPPGRAFCIFFGPTPASTDEHPRAASPVNVFGHIKGDAVIFRAVQSGSTVRVERSGAPQ
ncbi:MAG TPA: cyclophilin-like fold protein [Desulfatiglandales bacterium]|nr:cyclophilin-like fold protein [Desulfatiglandales bacterium]